jgi:hypothetical protein
VIAKPLVNGLTAFYFNIPTRRRKNGCPVPNERWGENYIIAGGEDGTGGRAAVLNQMFDEWERVQKGLPISSELAPRIGTVDWLFREYKQSKAYLERYRCGLV